MARPPASRFDLARLRAGLKPMRLYWFPRLRSTNDHAAALRQRGELFAPAVVLTGRQVAGRGRGSHRWWSGPGTLTVTFVFPIDDARAAHQIPLAAGLAVRDAAAEICGDDSIQLKWPNDMLYRGRKLAGLLCERVHRADLIGLGLNVNAPADSAGVPAELSDRLQFLDRLAGRPLDLTDALLVVARHLHRMFVTEAERPFATILADYHRHHTLVGRRVRVIDNGPAATVSGRCEGLDEMGRLIIRGRDMVHRVIAGQVQAY